MEYFRAWKLFTLWIGVSILVLGSVYYQQQDWDVTLSILMALLTYITAPLAVKAIRNGGFMAWTGALTWWIFTVDTTYMIYNGAMGNYTIRGENLIVSTCLYWMCGLLWVYEGKLSSLANEIKERLNELSKSIPG